MNINSYYDDLCEREELANPHSFLRCFLSPANIRQRVRKCHLVVERYNLVVTPLSSRTYIHIIEFYKFNLVRN
jgi:hypothetical protein